MCVNEIKCARDLVVAIAAHNGREFSADEISKVLFETEVHEFSSSEAEIDAEIPRFTQQQLRDLATAQYVEFTVEADGEIMDWCAAVEFTVCNQE